MNERQKANELIEDLMDLCQENGNCEIEYQNAVTGEKSSKGFIRVVEEKGKKRFVISAHFWAGQDE